LITTSFQDTGDHLIRTYSLLQRQRFFTEIAFYLMSQAEQKVRLADRILTAKEYLEYRMGADALNVVMTSIK
jgi:hypothetical protein